MEKHKLLSLVKRTSDYFDGDNYTPTKIYQEVINDKYLESLNKILNAKDIVIFSLLVPRFIMGSDIDEDYDRIEYNMFTIETVQIYNNEPEVDCPECRGGFEPCDHCDATGDEECRRCDGTGEEDCDYCDGSGVYEDGEECDMCQGSGRMTCGRCNGSGYESCNYCNGDGETTCTYCWGNGTIVSDEASEVIHTDYVSWSNRWKMYFANIKHNELIDDEDIRNFHNNNQTLVLGNNQEISNEYQGYDEDDTILFRMNEKPILTHRWEDGIVTL